MPYETPNPPHYLKPSAIAIAVAVALTLNACTDSTTTENPDPIGNPDPIENLNLTSLEPGIIDGYIKDALVCFDTNDNGLCSDEEPNYRALSDELGKASLNVPEDFLSNYPLIAEFTEETFDVGRGQKTGQGGYSAPVGKSEVLTPLTTLVHKELIKDPALDISAATNNVKILLKIDITDDVDLFVDHIAKAASGDADADAYKRLAVKAELAHNVLENMQATVTKITNALGDTEVTDPQALQLAFNQLRVQLDSLMDKLETEIDAAIVNGTALDDFTRAVKVTDVPLKDFTEEDLKSELETVKLNEAITQAASIDVKVVLKAGIFSFSGGGYTGVKLNAAENELLFDSRYFNGTSWIAIADSDGSSSICLGTDGWQTPTSNSSEKIAFNPDGTVTTSPIGTNCSGIIRQLNEVSLEGQKWVTFFNLNSGSGIDDKVFSADAKAYPMEIRLTQNQYNIVNNTNEGFTSCWVNGSEVSVTDLNGNCNVILSTSTQEAAKSFDEVFYPAGTDFSSEKSSLWLHNRRSRFLSIMGAAGDKSGTAKAFHWPAGASNWEELNTVNWEIKAVNGQDIMHFDLPSSLMHENSQPILAIQNGFVRTGYVQLASETYSRDEDAGVLLNKAAFDQIFTDADYKTSLSSGSFSSSQSSSSDSYSSDSYSSDSYSSDSYSSDSNTYFELIEANIADQSYTTNSTSFLYKGGTIGSGRTIISFYKGGTGKLTYQNGDGYTGSESITWAIDTTLGKLKVTYLSDSSYDMLSFGTKGTANYYSTGVVSYDSQGVEVHDSGALLFKASHFTPTLLAGKTLNLESSPIDTCKTSSINFITESSATMLHSNCTTSTEEIVDITVQLTISVDSSTLNVVLLTADDGSLNVKMSLVYGGDLSSHGLLFLVNFDNNGTITDLNSILFTSP